jgi:hypothetical protein
MSVLPVGPVPIAKEPPAQCGDRIRTFLVKRRLVYLRRIAGEFVPQTVKS